MKNLTLNEASVRQLDVNSDEILGVCLGYNEAHESEIYVCKHNLIISKFNINGEVNWTKDVSAMVSQDNIPVNLTYLTLLRTLFVSFRNGELFTIADRGTVTDLVGVFECGVLAAEWSPDQEILVIITKEMKAISITCTYDVVHEVDLYDEEFGANQFITVGWGKKETQFHGTAGKQAAKAANEVEPDDNALSDSIVKITWRGDGMFYAAGFTFGGVKRFKVFDREGQLLYTSEKQQGLESNLCWRPSGNLITTTQKIQNKYLVSFFEKNGLKHGEFDITHQSVIVENIAWSADSEILALLCIHEDTFTQQLLLYTTCNYHWYLKQTLSFNNSQVIIQIFWDNDFDVPNNKKLHVILKDGTYLIYNWNWTVDHSYGKCDEDDAVITVIDGNKILLTNFRQSVVPPPMCATTIELDAPINAVFFAPNIAKLDPNSFFVWTSKNQFILYKQTRKVPLKYEKCEALVMVEYNFPFQNYNWCWVTQDIIVCVGINQNYTYDLVEYEIESKFVSKKNSVPLPSAVVCVRTHPNDNTLLFLQLNNGKIAKYKQGMENIVYIDDISFNTPCPKFNVFCVAGFIHFIGLCQRGSLHIDNVVINHIGSYFIHTHFLLITTSQHELLCTELTESGLNAIMEYVNEKPELVYKRKIERGAKLVIAVPNDTRTVLQMPRGNLEAIQPRPLSLKIIGEYLDSYKYHEAFDLMRKQRINLNLVHDHNPELFIKNIDLFLEKIDNNSWLNLFLSDLENLDVTKTMYANSYASKNDNARKYIENKITNICDMVRENLLRRSDKENKILPILTTFVKKNNVDDLERALLIIKDLKLKECNVKLPVGSDEALKYLLYMVDVNQLFDVALGMYDFDLVLLVANKSQKDPKEYIPMLNELNEMDKDYKKFSINKHLKRFDKAVKCLIQCGPEKYNELKTFVKYHSLYKEALSQFSMHDEIFKEISEDFGSYLSLQKQFTEAGIIFARVQNIDKAVECYKEVLEWELAISITQTWPKEKFKELCWDLINMLKEQKRHKEALIILEQYYGDCEEAITYATECGQYKTAMRLCSQYGKTTFMENILSAVMKDYTDLKEQIETNHCTFLKYRNRLAIVREQKLKNPVVNKYESYMQRDCDLYSDFGSTLASSKGSSRSYRSGKNRRKHERKMASLKEGSQYEDVALVMALHNLVTSVFDLRLLVKEIVITLTCFFKEAEAIVLQTSLDKLLNEMKDSFKDIWTNKMVLEAIEAEIAAHNLPEGATFIPQGLAALDPHFRTAPVIQDIKWKLDGIN